MLECGLAVVVNRMSSVCTIPVFFFRGYFAGPFVPHQIKMAFWFARTPSYSLIICRRPVSSFYIPALAALVSVGVRRASTAWLKYMRYERWMPYITGKTTNAACQPK